MLSHFPPETSSTNFDRRCFLIPDNSPCPQVLEQELESLHSLHVQSSKIDFLYTVKILIYYRTQSIYIFTDQNWQRNLEKLTRAGYVCGACRFFHRNIVACSTIFLDNLFSSCLKLCSCFVAITACF